MQAAIASHWFHDYTPRTGDVVIDVGAGIGEDAVVISHLVGATGRVHAIEAHPATFACIRSTVGLSQLANVTIHQIAIAEENGTVSISDDAHHLANSIIGQTGGLEVEAQSLDHFIAQSGHPTIDLLKMNIEGAERGAILGLDKQAGTSAIWRFRATTSWPTPAATRNFAPRMPSAIDCLNSAMW